MSKHAPCQCGGTRDRKALVCRDCWRLPTDVLVERMRRRPRVPEHDGLDPDENYLRELNEGYQHFFFHYSSTPLLVVETSQINLEGSDEAVDALIRQIKTMNRGTRYYVPRT